MTNSLRVVSIAALLSISLTACSTEHEFRVGAVGDSSAQSASGSTAISADAPLVVVAGNALLGSASQLVLPGALGTSSGVVDGTVSAVLLTTGQTLIALPDGATLLVNSTGGTLGDMVSVDLGTGQVVGGSSALVGANVLGTGSTAGIAGTGVGSSTTVASVTGATGVLPTIGAGSTLSSAPTTTTILPPLGGTIGGTLGTGTGTIGSLCC